MNALKERVRYDERERRKREDDLLNRYLRRNMRKQTAEQLKESSTDLVAMILWSLAQYTEDCGKPWGKKKLLDFGRRIDPNFNELVRHYDLDGDDVQFLCLKMLKDNKDITREEITGLLQIGAEVKVKERNGEVHSA